MPAALERTYDGIIIGAGHHGLILGTYLAKAGLDILLVERRLNYGGGLPHRRSTQPGFYHNLHSINHFHITRDALVQGPEACRARHLHHAALRVRPGAPRRHARWCSAAISRRRRQRRALLKKGRADLPRMEPAAEAITRADFPARALFRAAAAGRARSAAVAHARSAAISSRSRERQPLDVVKELFENEHVQLLFLFKVSLFGTWLVDTMSKTSPMGSVIRAFDLESGYQLCQGGSFNLARGLMETFIAAGGRYQPQVSIERILIEGGKATRHRARRRPHGPRPAVRRQHARRAPDLRDADRPRAVAGAVPAASSTGSNTPRGRFTALHLALHEARSFAAAAFDPNINRALKWSLGAETMAGPVRRPSRRAGRPRADAYSVRLRPAEPASIRPRRRPASTRPMPGT